MRRYEVEDEHCEMIRNLFAGESRGQAWRDHRTMSTES